MLNENLGDTLFLKVYFNGFPNETIFPFILGDLDKIRYISLLLDLVGLLSWLHGKNVILIRPILNKTPYELLKGRKPNLSHLHVFECKCFILNTINENIGQFDAKADEGIFLGYSQPRKPYKVYNKILVTVKEYVHVTFDESYPRNVGKGISFHDAYVSLKHMVKHIKERIDQPEVVKPEKEEYDNPEEEKDESPTKVEDLHIALRTSMDHQIDNILGDITKGI